MELSSKPDTCPICNSNEIRFIFDCPDHFLSGEVFQLFECNSCKARLTFPQPPPTKIFDYYKSDEYVSHSDTQKGLINFAYQKVKTITLRQKVALLNKRSPGKVLLDYGCGTGDFLQYAKTKGYKTIGLEPDQSARQLAADKSLDVHSLEWVKDTPTQFDAITLWHVLEHTYDPGEVLKSLRDKLTGKGILVIAVPNYASYDANYYDTNWAAYDVPRHLFHFHPKTINYLAEELDMKLEASIGMPFDSFYVSMLSEKYKKGNSLSGVITGLRSNIKARKSRNYSSLIYILRK